MQPCSYSGVIKRQSLYQLRTDLIEVSLPDEPELVGEDVSVGGDAGHGAGHVLVQTVNLLRVEDLIK